MPISRQQSESALPRPEVLRNRRLPSFSSFKKSLNLRRSNVSDQALDIGHPYNFQSDNDDYLPSPPHPPRARKSSFGLNMKALPALPRSSTYSSIPQPVLEPRMPRKRQIPSSKSSNALLPISSRISTPGGHRDTSRHTAATNPTIQPPSQLGDIKSSSVHSVGTHLAPDCGSFTDEQHFISDVRTQCPQSNFARPDQQAHAVRHAGPSTLANEASAFHSNNGEDSTWAFSSTEQEHTRFEPRRRLPHEGYALYRRMRRGISTLHENNEPLLDREDALPGIAAQNSPRSSIEVKQRETLNSGTNGHSHAIGILSISEGSENNLVERRDAHLPPSSFRQPANNDYLAKPVKTNSSPLASVVKSPFKKLIPKSASLSQIQDPECFEDGSDGTVRTYKPSSYWTGRYISLKDKYHTSEGSKHLNQKEQTPDSGMFSSKQESDIAIWVFDQLEPTCITEEAQASLRNFKRRLAKYKQLPALLDLPDPNTLPNPEARKSTVWGAPPSTTSSGHDGLPPPPPPALMIPRKPVTAMDGAFPSPRSVNTTDTSDSHVPRGEPSYEDSSEHLLEQQHSRSERQAGAKLVKEKSFVGKLIDFGRKGSWNSFSDV